MKKLLHFSPDMSGFRYLNPLKKALRDIVGEDVYSQYAEPKPFLATLAERTGALDVVVISAHGGNDCLLMSVRNEYEPFLDVRDAGLFRHDFVFAISCYTVNQLGPEAVKNGAQAYLGFNDSVDPTFKFSEPRQNRYSKTLSLVFKYLFAKTLCDSMIEFICHCCTAKQLTQYLGLFYQMHLASLMDMSADQFKEKFSISRNSQWDEEVMAQVRFDLIGKFDDIIRRIELIGNDNYICWYNIEQQGRERLRDLLDHISDFNPDARYYGYFIEYLIYKALGFPDCSESLDKLQSELRKLGLDDSFFMAIIGDRLVS